MNIRLGFALLAAACAAQAEPLNPGLWEVTTESEMEGVPTRTPPVKRQRCIGPQEARPGGLAAVPPVPSSPCEPTGFTRLGGAAHWTVRCGGLGGQGMVRYDGDSYRSTLVLVMAGEGMRMVHKLSGKRLGDCKP